MSVCICTYVGPMKVSPSLFVLRITVLSTVLTPVYSDSLSLYTTQAVSYVSRRRMDQADFDPYEIDADGLPLVYNEERIASFWKGKPGSRLPRLLSQHLSQEWSNRCHKHVFLCRRTHISMGKICCCFWYASSQHAVLLFSPCFNLTSHICLQPLG